MTTIQLDHRVMKIRSAKGTNDFLLFAVCCLLFTVYSLR